MVRVLFRKLFLFMLFIVVMPAFAHFAFAAVHQLYAGFNSAEQGFIFNNASNVVSVSDTIVYRVGYYSIKGDAWIAFNLSGSYYNENIDWLSGVSSGVVPVFGVGEHYLIVYSCSLADSSWNCHDDKWQLIVVNNSFDNSSNNISNESIKSNESGLCGSGEYMFKDVCLLNVSGNTYFVSPDGNDNNPGNFTHPWATWGKAFNDKNVNPGDIVYFRGGVYMKAWGEGDYYHVDGKSYRIDRGGNSTHRLYYWAYPGEEPILDCGNILPVHDVDALNYAIRGGAPYTHFKGLTIRNVWSREDGCARTQVSTLTSGYVYEVKTGVINHNGLNYSAGERFTAANNNFTGNGSVYYVQSVQAYGWKMSSNHVIIENCKIYNVHGICFDIRDGANDTYIINSDAYNCTDIWAYPPQLTGNRGTGISVTDINNHDRKVYVKNCRAWNCGDQGFVGGTYGYVEFDGCWSFNNGILNGGGHGFKIGYWDLTEPWTGDALKRKLTNNIAAYNRESGITTNDNVEHYPAGMNIYNNICYDNGDDGTWRNGGYGIYVYRTLGNNRTREELREFRNNIVYSNEVGGIYVANGAYYTHSNNNWDTQGIITNDEDFVYLPLSPSEGFNILSAPRKPNGSLPDLNGFLQLNSNSDLIDAGVDVSLPYNGSAPDLGPFESNY